MSILSVRIYSELLSSLTRHEITMAADDAVAMAALLKTALELRLHDGLTYEKTIEKLSMLTLSDAEHVPEELGASEIVINIPELRALILSKLPLEDMYRARCISPTFREHIDHDPHLRRLMFKRPEKATEERNMYDYSCPSQQVQLSAPTFLVNPIFNRTIILPREGSIQRYAMLERIKSSSQSSPSSSGQSIVENVLEWRPANLVERQPKQELVDDVKRPFRFYWDTNLQKVPFKYSCQARKRGRRYLQSEWKSMLFCQPPVQELALIHTRRTMAWLVRDPEGVTLWSILSSLQGVFGANVTQENPEPQGQEPQEGDLEVDVLLPLCDADGAPVRDRRELRVCRAMDTKIKCRFETEHGECGKLPLLADLESLKKMLHPEV